MQESSDGKSQSPSKVTCETGNSSTSNKPALARISKIQNLSIIFHHSQHLYNKGLLELVTSLQGYFVN
jgi:hypothetical protein